MRLVILLPLGAAVALAVLFWASGGDRLVLAWAAEGQRAAQGEIGGALRGLRAGDAAAAIPFLAVCFAYGFFHAAGPGHGKLVIGGYGAARRVGALRLSTVALASSLAQGATAIALVAGGMWLLGLGRERMVGLAEGLFQPLGFAAIALIGLWLAFRGLRGMTGGARRGAEHRHDHGTSNHHGTGHDHAHTHAPGCGHAHAPSADDIAAATGPRELAALVAAVAIRPCTGALFVLVVTAQMGAFAWGVAGTVAMALGTASVTVAVALAAVGLRRGVLAGLSDSAARVQPGIEIAVGLAVAWIAGGLALATL